MTLYRCPREDLGCSATFPTTGDLDYHLHLAHYYGRLARFGAALPPTRALPGGPRPARRVPDGLEGGAGTPTTAQSRHARDARPVAAAGAGDRAAIDSGTIGERPAIEAANTGGTDRPLRPASGPAEGEGVGVGVGDRSVSHRGGGNRGGGRTARFPRRRRPAERRVRELTAATAPDSESDSRRRH
ncbi:hypothetical protein [Frankia sp. R43]|uniref:hypothetical protein n=1 Tax=Frankia sp. R43 TaxID=269536 RepID=UPI0006CA3A17|nr:hypothetical protein [Frankia sp. R43]